jgi:peroxiredoxin
MSLSQRILLLSIAVLAGIGGSLSYRYFSQPDLSRLDIARSQEAVQEQVPDLVGAPRPDYRLGSSEGAWVSAADFDGQPVLVNFWATWCQPCREEMPMLSALYEELEPAGFTVVGIALDDVEQARQFAAELGINYPILVGSTDVMAVVRDYGNVSGVLPYSVLLDSDGIIRWTYLGELQEAELRSEISSLLLPAQSGQDGS